MKLKNIISLFIVALVLSLHSCYDEKMEWGKNPLYGDVTISELPLELKEMISRYDVLKNYTEMTLGVGIDLSLYLSDETYRNIINENFDQITPSNELKQTSLMNSSGVLNFTRIDERLAELERAGLAVYGHTLVWHNQQQASYFNTLIAPIRIMPPAGSNLLSNGSFEEDFESSGWGSWGGEWEIVSENALDGDKMLKVTAGTGTDAWSTQVRTEPVATVVGHQYEISFFIRSEGEGEIRLSIGGANQMSNRWPSHQDAVDGRPNNVVATSPTWQQITYSSNTITSADPWTAIGESVQFDLDLGQVPNMVYYIDNVIVTDLDAEVDGNLLSSGGFESGDLSADGWGTPNAGAGIEITAEEVRNGTYAVKLTASSTTTNDWDLQLATPAIPVISGNQYEISFYIKSDIAGKGRLSFSGMSNGYPFVNGAREFSTSTNWERVVYSPETLGNDEWAATADELKISFDLGLVPDVTYYIDDVTVVNLTAASARSSALRAGPTLIEKTPEEKFEILEPLYIQYITDVASHFAGKIVAWDVVNEPMNENGTLRSGEENLDATDVFYWQYYLGKDYAVTAFKTARAADPNAKLFVNDYNLESSSGAKLNGLIDYVKYIEQQGGQVDGIGTQLHVDIRYTSQEDIENMFKRLAETGKLIKITELDIKFGTNSPTVEQYAEQAEMYRYIIESYKRNIPENLRSGITVWGISDNDQEHQYWIPDDAPNLWDKNYERKHSYKGFADGLVGEDIGAGFPGDLVY